MTILYEAKIYLRLPDLNTYNAISRTRNVGAILANQEKQKTQSEIGIFLHPIESPIDCKVNVHCIWHVSNKKRDPDNISFAIKFLLDACVKFGILKNDNMNCISSIKHDFIVDGNDLVELLLEV